MIYWYRHGRQLFRAFSTRRKEGFEQARTKALMFLRQMGRNTMKALPRPEVNRSGISGVYFDHVDQLWVAVWNQHGVRQFRGFPVTSMGFDTAYKAAVMIRKEKLAESHKFVMHRWRFRRGRNPYH